MHHRRLRITTIAVVSTSALLAGSGSRLAAQDTTEPPGTTSPAESTAPGPVSVIELAPGFTAEVFAVAPSDRAPDQTVYLARFVIQPGSEIYPHSHPGTTVLGVESGTLGWTLLEGTAHVIRGAAAGNTEVEDVTEPGTEVILEVGDEIYYEDDVVHTARGAGDEETVVWGTLVLTTGEPLLMPVDMNMGTTEPAAGTEPAGTAVATTTG